MAYSDKEKNKLISDILKDISGKGLSLRKACKKNKLPTITFYEWIDNDEQKAIHYARACEERADMMFEDILHIADDTSRDTQTVDLDGIELEQLNQEAIQRSKLRVDARKWALSKMQPRKYGDKLDLTSDGEKLPNTSIPLVLQDGRTYDDLKKDLTPE